MDREKLFKHLERRYTSKREMISRIPLGVQPDAMWQELLNQRRSRSTVIPLYNAKGQPFWYVTTEKMVAASEKILEALFENEAVFDPYTETLPVSTLEEVFYTSYVEGAQISIQAAMEFLSSDLPPRDIEEQMITNNRIAGNYAAGNLYRPIDSQFLRELAYLLTDGMDQGGQDFRATDEVDFSAAGGETFEFPSCAVIPDRMGELTAFLEAPNIHPLIKAAVAQAYLMILRPFPEGNDRLGRMVSSIILLRAGYTFFSEVSLSALIARKSYSYYEAVLNILREENGGDMTYFIEYYLELLSRAVDERRLRQNRREEQDHQAERELARTPLSTVSAPVTIPPPTETIHEPESAEQMIQDPNQAEEGGELLEGFIPVSTMELEPWDEDAIYTEDAIRVARVKDELYRKAAEGGPLTRACAKLFLGYIEKGVSTFTMEDIAEGCSVTATQAGNLITHMKGFGLIESSDQRRNRCMLYQIGTGLPPLQPEDYAPELLEAVKELRFSSRSTRDRRAGEIIMSCLPKGLVTAEDYASIGDAAKLTGDLALPEHMGIVEKLSAGVYRISRQILSQGKPLTPGQKNTLTALYQSFGKEPFTREEAAESLKQSKSSTCTILHQFTVLRLLECKEEVFFIYRFLVDPDTQPELFNEGAAESVPLEKVVIPETVPTPDEDDSPAYSTPEQSAYSEAVYHLLETLASSATSIRDRRLAEALRRCLDKGTLLRSDYEDWGHSVNMWLSDTTLAEQLGLITKMPNGDYSLNRELSSKFPELKPHQKRTITAIYEAFGDQEFSQEMIVATLNYSVSYTYASLHKLTLLRILEQRTTEGVSQYQLMVNPEDHPECFEIAA